LIFPLYPISENIRTQLRNIRIDEYDSHFLTNTNEELQAGCPECPKAFYCIDKNIDFMQDGCQYTENSINKLFDKYNIPVKDRFSNQLYEEFMSNIDIKRRNQSLGDTLQYILSHVFYYSLIKNESPDFNFLSKIINEELDDNFDLFSLNALDFFSDNPISKGYGINIEGINLQITQNFIWASLEEKNDEFHFITIQRK
jgi:hypothetical protein